MTPPDGPACTALMVLLPNTPPHSRDDVAQRHTERTSTTGGCALAGNAKTLVPFGFLHAVLAYTPAADEDRGHGRERLTLLMAVGRPKEAAFGG